jgi:predicted nucleic acid-binding protein
MTSVFLDTSGLIALTDTDDYWHSRAIEVWHDLLLRKRRLVTTSLVLIELADGLAKVHFRSVAIQLKEALTSSQNVELVQVDERLEAAGWYLFRERSDKDWGMTDCVSFSLMTTRKLTDVFGLDHHFEQAGFNLLIKD